MPRLCLEGQVSKMVMQNTWKYATIVEVRSLQVEIRTRDCVEHYGFSRCRCLINMFSLGEKDDLIMATVPEKYLSDEDPYVRKR